MGLADAQSLRSILFTEKSNELWPAAMGLRRL